jgi:hypothetical protein
MMVMPRPGLAQAVQEIDEGLGVAVGDIDADVADGVACLILDAAELFVVLARDAHRIEHRRRFRQGLEKCDQITLVVVFVQRCCEFGGLFNASAISKVPTVSMLAAMTGTPR